MSVFNPEVQSTGIDSKIVAGLERISQAFRILLWEKAKVYGLSPIQIQLLIFIRHHSPDKSTVSYLAREFNLTKPTISDAVKVLEVKELICKITDPQDTRSYSIALTEKGSKLVADTEHYAHPLTEIVSAADPEEKKVLWNTISDLIIKLNKSGVINVQRNCVSCRHYAFKNEEHFCNLVKQSLQSSELRLDCGDFMHIPG